LTHDTRHLYYFFLMGELVAALRANAPDAYQQLLFEGVQKEGCKI
jgi:hypothetical protein